MSKFKYDHGVELKDTITGYKGTVTGRADYITGCNQYLLQPKIKAGEFKEGTWWDEDRLVKTSAKKKTVRIGRDPGGPRQNPAPIK